MIEDADIQRVWQADILKIWERLFGSIVAPIDLRQTNHDQPTFFGECLEPLDLIRNAGMDSFLIQ